MYLAKWNVWMVERDSSEVSIFWKIGHVITLTIVVASSLLTVVEFDIILQSFANRCILYAQLNFANASFPYRGDTIKKLTIFNPYTIWSTNLECGMVRGTLFFSLITSMIFVGLFLILPKGGNSYRSLNFTYAWKITFPAFIIAFIMTLFIIPAYSKIKYGLEAFCVQFPMKKPSCSSEVNNFTFPFWETTFDVTEHIHRIRFNVIIMIVSWTAYLTTLILRLVIGPDFKINKVYMYKAKEDKPKPLNMEENEDDERKSIEAAPDEVTLISDTFITQILKPTISTSGEQIMVI